MVLVRKLVIFISSQFFNAPVKLARRQEPAAAQTQREGRRLGDESELCHQARVGIGGSGTATRQDSAHRWVLAIKGKCTVVSDSRKYRDVQQQIAVGWIVEVGSCADVKIKITVRSCEDRSQCSREYRRETRVKRGTWRRWR